MFYRQSRNFCTKTIKAIKAIHVTDKSNIQNIINNSKIPFNSEDPVDYINYGFLLLTKRNFNNVATDMFEKASFYDENKLYNNEITSGLKQCEYHINQDNQYESYENMYFLKKIKKTIRTTDQDEIQTIIFDTLSNYPFGSEDPLDYINRGFSLLPDDCFNIEASSAFRKAWIFDKYKLYTLEIVSGLMQVEHNYNQNYHVENKYKESYFFKK